MQVCPPPAFCQPRLEQGVALLDRNGDSVADVCEKQLCVKCCAVCTCLGITVVFSQPLYWSLCCLTDVHIARS